MRTARARRARQWISVGSSSYSFRHWLANSENHQKTITIAQLAREAQGERLKTRHKKHAIRKQSHTQDTGGSEANGSKVEENASRDAEW
eukprot:6184170-Pleurochrysis_carterae.AAC.2